MNLLQAELPNSYEAHLLQIFRDAYQEAYELGKKQIPGEKFPTTAFDAPLELERLPDMQGLSAQNQLLKWARQYPDSLEATYGENKKKRPHACVCSKRLKITTHRVLKPGDFPRPADYRMSNATSNQLQLGILQPNKAFEDMAYVYILHGPSKEVAHELGFVQIAMPDANSYRSYIAISDIYLGKEFEKPKCESIQDKTFITLREAAKTAED